MKYEMRYYINNHILVKWSRLFLFRGNSFIIRVVSTLTCTIRLIAVTRSCGCLNQAFQTEKINKLEDIMTYNELDAKLSGVLKRYQSNFSEKVYVDTYKDTDVLIETFGITQELKRENKQFWGRQLGKCWELLVIKLCRYACDDYADAIRFGIDEPCDLILGSDAIDTKYRVGSGDSGTLKKFRDYGRLLKENGYRPVLLFLREDNLNAAIKAFETGGWTIYTGDSTFKYLHDKTSFNLYDWLCYHRDLGTFLIKRKSNI